MGTIKNIYNSVTKYFSQFSGGQSFSTWTYNTIGSLGRRDLLHEYKNLVAACIDAISSDFARYQPVFFTQEKGTDKKRIIQHPFMKVLENPNPDLSQYELNEITISFIELTGECFWYVSLGETTRKPKELYIVRPDRVKVAINPEDGRVAGYTVRRDDGTEIPIDPDEMIHHKTFNPINPYRGLGTVQKGLLYINTENETSEFQYNFMKNQATPSGVLTLNGNIGREAFNKVKTQWAENHGGTANAGKTLLIRETDAKFEKIGLSISDLQMGELKQITDRQVRQMFRVPKPILGETDSTGLGRANVEAVEYIFARRTIDPKMTKMDDTIRMVLKRYYKENRDVKVEHVSPIPDDKEARLAEDKELVGKVKTINEAREERGLPPKEGGDDIYVEFNKVSVSSPVEKSKGKIIIKRTFKTKSKPVVKTAQDTFFAATEKIETTTDNHYRNSIVELLKEQRDKVIQMIADQLGSKKIFDESMPEDAVEARVWATAITPKLLEYVQQAGELGIDFLGVEDIEFVLSQATRDAVFESTERLAKSFNRETVLKLQKQLADGVSKNESVAQLTKRVELVYEDAIGYRAKRIARTEAHKSINAAVAESYRQSGIHRMKWQITGISTCEFCQAMDGTVIEIGSSFIPKGGSIVGVDGGEYLADYDDIKYADAHPNCDCKLVPVLDEKNFKKQIKEDLDSKEYAHELEKLLLKKKKA